MSFRLNALRAAAGAAMLSVQALAWATPSFVNGLVLDGATLDLSGRSNANTARLGYFSDIYFDPNRNEWWGLSDRGPGGGVIDYATRVQRFTLDIDAATGAISNFKVAQTVKFTTAAGEAFNGLNPLLLSGGAGNLGRSFDPEGFVVNPKNGNFYVSDEYGPSLYEFDRNGVFLRAFATPANLVPRVGTTVDHVAGRDAGLSLGRQDNRGFEGLAVSPDGNKLYAVLQDPLIDDVASRNGRNGRNVRIVEFDAASGASTRQLAYQLEAQADIAARITAAGGTATPTDPRQGRNVGLSAIVALNGSEFLVLERDNRGLGVDDPAGANVVGSKRVYKIDLSGASDVSAAGPLGAEALPAGVVPVAKSATFIDLAADTVMPNGKQAEKWEGLAIGPQLADGSHLLLAGTDNDYSVTQTAAAEQFDVYVDFAGNSVQCPLDVACAPKGYQLIPAVLHAYKAGAADLSDYLQPVPEPQTYALMGGGLALVAAWARRRRRLAAG